MATKIASLESILPSHKDLFYAGDWHSPINGNYREVYNPGNGTVIDRVAEADASDIGPAVVAAHKAFGRWKLTSPWERATKLRQAATLIREHAHELAMLDAFDTGNPVAEMLNDANVAAGFMDYFAGLVPMLKGETIPQGDDTFHYTIREPLGVVVRIVAYNHPVMFAGAKLAAPIAAGNTVIIKPSEFSPLSCLRLAEILAPVFPAGVLSVMPGGVECGKALTTHPLVRKVTLIGSVPTGKAIQKAVADSLKPTLLELGGKNALIAFPDANVDSLVAGIAKGMNFTWAGQSCGSTSRVFLHESHHDEVLERVTAMVQISYKPGVPTEMTTTMGPVISEAAYERVLSYIESGKSQGARLVCGGKPIHGNPAIKGGYFIEPTIFADVQGTMRIANEEIFGPVMSVFKWNDAGSMVEQVNAVPYGLTASIYTESLRNATDMTKKIEAGYIWINQTGRHFLNVPFGGYKESGIGREENLDELLSFTQVKSVSVKLAG